MAKIAKKGDSGKSVKKETCPKLPKNESWQKFPEKETLAKLPERLKSKKEPRPKKGGGINCSKKVLFIIYLVLSKFHKLFLWNCYMRIKCSLWRSFEFAANSLLHTKLVQSSPRILNSPAAIFFESNFTWIRSHQSTRIAGGYDRSCGSIRVSFSG